MQRKSSKQSRGAHADEKAFMAWCKEQPSIVSGTYGVEVHHCVGSSRKTYVNNERVHIGHWFVIPLTPDEHKLFHNDKFEFIRRHGEQSELWLKLVENYPVEIPLKVMQGIAQWER